MLNVERALNGLCGGVEVMVLRKQIKYMKLGLENVPVVVKVCSWPSECRSVNTVRLTVHIVCARL